MYPPHPPAVQAAVVRWLCEKYSDAQPREIATAAAIAIRGLETVGMVADAEAEHLGKMVAERELRLALGLDGEVARLDPERHRGRVEECPDPAAC